MDVNFLLFPDFETLDAFGPAEVLGEVAEYRLRYFSIDGGAVLSRQGAGIVTESAGEIDPCGILVVPGGQGTRQLVGDAAFLEKLAGLVEKSLYCLTVCTGSALVAKTGFLDGKKATSNKAAFDWVKSTGENVEWQRRARWTADEKFYTSSGVSAGMDMALGFVADRFGSEKARDIARGIEYSWNADKDCDLFAD